MRGETFAPVPNRGMITISIMLANIMQGVDNTILNVALPHIQGSLSASLDQIAWALTRWCGTERRSWRCAGRLRPLRSSSQRTCMGLFLSSGCFGLC